MPSTSRLAGINPAIFIPKRRAMDERQLAESDPRAFLDRFPDGAILDKIQRMSSLLFYIQGIVDDGLFPNR